MASYGDQHNREFLEQPPGTGQYGHLPVHRLGLSRIEPTDSKYLTVVDNNEINRSIRFRVVFEYLTHKHVFPSSLRASDNISDVLATQNVKQPFGHVVALLITILVLL